MLTLSQLEQYLSKAAWMYHIEYFAVCVAVGGERRFSETIFRRIDGGMERESRRII